MSAIRVNGQMLSQGEALQGWLADERLRASAEPDAEGRDLGIERHVFTRLCAHFFSAGPQPEEVMQRVFAAALDRRPDLLRGMDRRDVVMAAEESARGRRWRLRALFDGCGAHWREQYRVIVSTLSVAFNDAGRPEFAQVTLLDALKVHGYDDELPEATETLSRVLETIFKKGNDPRVATQQAFVLTGWLFRDLQMNMSLEELGRLFDETRAIQSWRAKESIERPMRAAGFRGCKASWQKTDTAVEAYREAAKGNTSRRKEPLRRLRPLPSKLNPTNHDDLHSPRPTNPGTTGGLREKMEVAA